MHVEEEEEDQWMRKVMIHLEDKDDKEGWWMVYLVMHVEENEGIPITLLNERVVENEGMMVAILK